MSTKGNHFVAIRESDGSLWTWGLNNAGQLGDGTTVLSKSSPVKIGSSSWSMVEGGSSHTAAIDITGALYAWGLNSNGQLGDGTAASKSSPVLITAVRPLTYDSWKILSVGQSYATAIRSSDSSLWTWGFNFQGNLGDGTTISKSSPVRIGSSSWNIVSTRNNTTLAIDITGALYTWGSGGFGQLGDNTEGAKSSPVQIGSSSWSMVSAGFLHAMAIDVTGALWAWGNNAAGQLGDGTALSKSSPVKIGSSSWSMVSAGVRQTISLDITGVLYTWGTNEQGQLGDGTTVNKSKPVTIITTTPTPANISQINTTGTGAAAITDGYSIWTIGNGANGQLGDGTVTNKNFLARQITAQYPKVITGDSHMLGIAANTLYAWGRNNTHQLGLGDQINRSTPVVVNLTTIDEDITQDDWKSI